MSFFDRLIVTSLPRVPRALVERVARRYVAGTTREDALRLVGQLNAEQILGTIDFLAEDLHDRSAALACAQEYEVLLESIATRSLHSHVSLKLTALGLHLDEALCEENLRRVVRAAGARHNFVRMDMEDHRCTAATLRIFQHVRADHESVGVVLQARLRRTLDDIDQLGRLRQPLNVRLCKGIYLEPESIAWQDREEIRKNYLTCLRRLFELKCYVGIATHDRPVIDGALAMIREFRLSANDVEFQMLLGVTPELRSELVRSGQRVRVYVPYGTDWYAYCVRRLQENPEIARHVIGSWFGRS